MSQIYIENFKSSVLQAQNYIYLACTLSFTLCLFPQLQSAGKVPIQMLGITLDATTALAALIVIYIAIGVVLIVSIGNANANFKKISNLGDRNALMLNPSIVCSIKPVRCLSVMLPPALFFIAIFNGTNGGWHSFGAISFVTFVVSSPYVIALLFVEKIFERS